MAGWSGSFRAPGRKLPRVVPQTESEQTRIGKGTMARESKAARAERATEAFDLLAEEYPDAHCALTHANAYQLGVATILSAQTTDERVNMVTPVLFERFPTPADLADARPEGVEEIIRSTGFFRNKTKSIIGFARGVTELHGGQVPSTMKELTANVILGNAFGLDEGVVVDTHVNRLSTLLAFTKEKTPEKIEEDLMGLFPRDRWTLVASADFPRTPSLHCQKATV